MNFLLLLVAPALAAASAGTAPYGAERLALVREVTELDLSPDGKSLAFVTDITGALELWTVPASGGWPEQVSWLSEQVTGLSRSADGRRMVFASDHGGDERPDLYLAEDGEVFQLTASTRAETEPVFSRDGARLAYLSDPQSPFLYQLMVMDLASKQERQLTLEPMNLHFPVWSQDGALIAVTRSGDDASGPLLLVDSATGKTRELAAPVKDGMLIAERFIDDKTLLCRARNAKGFFQLYWLDLPSGSGRFIGPGDWDVEDARWNAKAGIVYSRNLAGASAIERMKGPDAAPEVLVPVGGRIEDFDLDDAGGTLAYLRSDSSRPTDAWVMDLAARKERQVTRSAAGGVRSERLSKGEIIEYKSFDGRPISAIYIKPRVARLGEPAPLVVHVHGGPDWQSFDDFYPIRQALAEAGFAVLAPNFRGSSGFGWEHLAANRKDWGGADLKDLVAGVEFLSKRREIDPSRVGITGGSYGGYMTLMALTKTPGIWGAGVEAYGMPDLVQDYELSKTRFQDWYETQMGNPTTHAALFRDRSAVHFLGQVRAPLMIFQGANDTNVPAAESELVYNELKKRGRPVELVVYPDEGHGFTRRNNRTDYYRRTVEFFTRTIGR